MKEQVKDYLQMPSSLNVYKNFKTGQLGLYYAYEYAPVILISPKQAFLITESVDFERLRHFCERLNLEHDTEDQFIFWRDVAVPLAVQLLKLHLDHLGHRATNYLPGWWEIGEIDTQGLHWWKKPFPVSYEELEQATGIDMRGFKTGSRAKQKAMVEQTGILTTFRNVLDDSPAFRDVVDPDYSVYLDELIATEAVARLKANEYHTPSNIYSIQLILRYSPFDTETGVGQAKSLFFSKLVDARAEELITQRKSLDKVETQSQVVKDTKRRNARKMKK